MRLPRFQLPGILLASALGLFGCHQGLGDRCVQDSDCASGHCSAEGETTQGGICQAAPNGTGTGTGGTVGSGGTGGEGAGGMSVTDGSTDAPAAGGASGGAGGAGGSAGHDAATD